MTPPGPNNAESFHEQRDWLRVTLACIGDAVITTDVDGRVTFLNPLAESLTGWTLAAAIGCPLDAVIRLVNEGTREAVETPSLRALSEGRTATLTSDSILIAKDGSEYSISDSAALIRNEHGEVAGIVMIFRDITERRETERALEKALHYADDIIATLREPFVVLDSELRVKTANFSFYQAFKVTQEETVGRFVYDLGNGQWDIPNLRKLLDEVLDRKQAVNDYEMEHDFPGLGRKTMLLNARPFPPNSKHPELILLAVQDVSALREKADELAQANRNKDEFLATLAHELRNPLSPIRNAVHYLGMAGIEHADVKPISDLIARQVDVMVRLIDDLLDIARISRNKLDIRRERISLASVLLSAIETSRPLIEQSGHELTVSLPPETLKLDADPVRLAQVFLNLLNNAAKYTDRGGQISLTAQQEEGEAVVTIRDNGIGIPGDMLEHVFDMFAQVDRSLERSEGGLGIGLTLVRRLIAMHGGTIAVHSGGLGEGSEFVVRLPCVESPEDSSPAAASIRPAGLTARRILVVDDNRDSAHMLAMLLRLKGNTLRTAHDGLEALDTAETFLPDLVLLDIGLPELNGYEVARRIRQRPWGKDMILVAVTGWGQEEDKRRSREAGFNFHVVKPLDIAGLEKLLDGAKPSVR